MGIAATFTFIAQTDLAPSDFFLFPKLKKHLKGIHFNDTNEAKQAVKTWLTKWSPDSSKMG